MFEPFAMEPDDNEQEFLPFISLDEEDDAKAATDAVPADMPVLPLKNTVLFPGVMLPITIGREKSIKAVQRANEMKDKLIAVFAQKDADADDPTATDLYSIGTVAKIVKLLRMPDGTTTAILQGSRRVELLQMTSDTPYLQGNVREVSYVAAEDDMEYEAFISTIRDKARAIIELSPNIPNEANVMLRNISSSSFLLNFIASNMNLKMPQKQAILTEHNLAAKANMVLLHVDAELQLLELKDQIENRVRNDIEKQQRDYFLNQQLKTIQEELGQSPQEADLARLEERAATKNWPEAAQKTFEKELNKLRRINPQAPDYAILFTYLELLVDLPWNEFTKDNFDLKKVKKVLDTEHYGLDDIKDRILEHLAVLKLKGDMKAPILCLVGPPGVGKTSLGKSIATALNRKFARMSLGGLHDESEIRGHRKTYIGAMPGRILQLLKKSGAGNPVFILDEIDKVGQSFRGDPSSALLEVLDPEQNTTFYDNYLDMEYDLSKVLFIATANSLGSIQPALLDRMEIIELSGYSIEEKVEIARQHLIPEQRVAHGLKLKDVSLSPEVIAHLIDRYTRESGVRNLDRRIAGVMRNTAKKVAMKEAYTPEIAIPILKDILGPERFQSDTFEQTDLPGVAIGLAWTSVGGDILYIEASLSKGKGHLTLTGNLGEVMKESATTALSYLRSHSDLIGLSADSLDEFDVHIHIPEGGIPKDGPSAGITMLTALASAFTRRNIKPHLAMTGEITLRGKVLPVGGIKEKILAAKRAGITDIVLCKDNQRDIERINAEYITGVSFHYVSTMQQVLDIALTPA